MTLTTSQNFYNYFYHLSNNYTAGVQFLDTGANTHFEKRFDSQRDNSFGTVLAIVPVYE